MALKASLKQSVEDKIIEDLTPSAEPDVEKILHEHSEFIDQVMAFFADRLKVALKEQGVRHDLVDAVFALGGEDDLVRSCAASRI